MSRATSDALYALSRYHAARAKTAPAGAAQRQAAVRAEMLALMGDDPEQAAAVYSRLDGLEDEPVSVKEALQALNSPAKVLRTLPQSDSIYHGPDGVLTVNIKGELAYGLLDCDRLISEIERAREVRLLINCPGGDTTAACDLWSVLRGKCSVATVYGKCWSSATVLLMAAPARKVCADATIMLHQPFCFTGGPAAVLRAKAEQLEEIVKNFTLIYREHCPADTVAHWLDGQDHWLTPEQALASGLASEICSLPEPHPLADE